MVQVAFETCLYDSFQKEGLIMKKIFPIILMAASIALVSCGPGEKDKGETVATVNGSPIALKEFQKEVSIAAKRDPNLKLTPEALEHQLHTVIDKKLMIQEALKKGLSQDEKFLDTIKEFWEQTLIRELVNSKSKEWSERLFVTDEEVQAHYKRIGTRLTLRLVDAEDKEKAEEAKVALAKGSFDRAEAVGPLLIEDVRLANPLYAAFDLSEGETAVFPGRDDFLVVRVIKKEQMPVPPLATVYADIKESLLEQKKEKALEDWLEELKASAEIEITKENLKKVK